MSISPNLFNENEVINIENTLSNSKRKRPFTSDEFVNEDGPSCSKNCSLDLQQTYKTELDVISSPAVCKDPSQSLLFEKYFTIIEEPMLLKRKTQAKRGSVLAKCLSCDKVLAGTLHVTSNFLRHLRRLHLTKYNEYEKLKQDAKIIPTKQDHFDKLVLTFIMKNMLPVSIVESNSFKTLLNFANPSLTVMSRPTAMKLMDTTFREWKTSLKEVIKSGGYFCSTADIWSTKHRSFFGYTVHWISETFERKSVSLACKRFSGVHSFDAIYRIIDEIHEEYALNITNLVATTTDNGSNFIKAYSEFGIINQDNFLNEYEVEFEIDPISTDSANKKLEGYLPNHIRCVSHTLNLIATRDFNKLLQSKNLVYDKHKQIFKKCSNLWSKINKPKSSEKIKLILGSQLKYPVVTRWNSLYDSVKDLMSHKLQLLDLCQQLGIERFQDKDLDYLAEYIELLRPIAEAIDFLQRQEGMMYGYLLPSLATILTKYGKMQLRNSSEYLKTMSAEMIGCIKTRFASHIKLEKTVHSAIVASVLCPAVKCQWVKALNPEYNTATEARMVNLAKDAVVAMAGEAEQLTPSSPEINISSYFSFSIAETSQDQYIDKTSLSDTEFLSYLADTSKSLSSLNKYPLIKKAFLKYNAPLPSSAAAERLFSYASMLNTPKSGSITDENFEKLLLLRVNNAL